MIRPAGPDDEAFQVLSNEGAMCGDWGLCGDQPGDRICASCEKVRARYIAALRAAGWAPTAELQQQLAAVKKDLENLQHTVTGVPR